MATPAPKTATDASHQHSVRRGNLAARRGHAAEASEPAPGADEEAETGQSPVEQRRPTDDAERLERRRQERITGILLADIPPVAQLNPLVRGGGRVVA